MFRHAYISLLSLVLVASSVLAQDKFVVPSQKVVVPEEVVPGEVIIVSVTPLKEQPKYLTDVRYDWKVLADGKEKANILIWPDNTKLIFSQGKAKDIKVAFIATYLYSVKEADKITEVAVRTSGLQIETLKLGKNPNPDPEPDPNPDPDKPDLPDGKFGLAKSAYQLANDKVNSDVRVKGAQAIATSTEGIASAISAGALKDPTEILSQLKTSNNAALKEVKVDPSTWDGFGVALQKVLFKLYQDGKLNTANDYADAFKELVTGLRQVK